MYRYSCTDRRVSAVHRPAVLCVQWWLHRVLCVLLRAAAARRWQCACMLLLRMQTRRARGGGARRHAWLLGVSAFARFLEGVASGASSVQSAVLGVLPVGGGVVELPPAVVQPEPGWEVGAVVEQRQQPSCVGRLSRLSVVAGVLFTWRGLYLQDQKNRTENHVRHGRNSNGSIEQGHAFTPQFSASCRPIY
eukprot:COSAG01_NODE_4931_length_4612_cov_14.102814_3_plen_192_part_00